MVTVSKVSVNIDFKENEVMLLLHGTFQLLLFCALLEQWADIIDVKQTMYLSAMVWCTSWLPS